MGVPVARKKPEDAKPDAWMPFYIAAYLSDTAHLSTEQHGGYVLLLLACWKGQGFLPDDDDQLQSITRMMDKPWTRARKILRGFFTPTGDGRLTQKRLASEYANAVLVYRKRVDSSMAGVNARAAKQQNDPPNDVPNGQPNGQPNGEPNEQHKDKDNLPTVESSLRSLRAGEDWLAWVAHWQALRKWSAARQMQALGHLRQIIAAGRDPNAVLRWALSRTLADLADCDRRMVADAGRKLDGESLADAARRQMDGQPLTTGESLLTLQGALTHER